MKQEIFNLFSNLRNAGIDTSQYDFYENINSTMFVPECYKIGDEPINFPGHWLVLYSDFLFNREVSVPKPDYVLQIDKDAFVMLYNLD